MKVSIKTIIEAGIGLWTVRHIVKAGGKVKPAWTTTLHDGYPASFTKAKVMKESRAEDQAVRNLFRNDRPQAASASALKRWFRQRHGA